MNLSRDEASKASVLSGVLEFMVVIPELFLPLLLVGLVAAMLTAPFYVAYHAMHAFTDTPTTAPITRSPMVELIAAAPLDAPCPYCGTASRETILVCPRCEVPHHAACWAENRGCTVYACGGSKSPSRWRRG